MTALFKYPAGASLDSTLTKRKIYQHSKPTTAVQRVFAQQVAQVKWKYKLAPETINIKATQAVPEIQIFSIFLREHVLKPNILRCIDRAIRLPIVFELMHNGKVKPIAAFKRPSEADSSQWVTGEYFEGDWAPEDTPRSLLPTAKDFGELYGHLLAPLMPYPTRPNEGMHAWVARMEDIRAKKIALKNCEVRLRREKQFNHQIPINAEMHDLKQELKILTSPLPLSRKAPDS